MTEAQLDKANAYAILRGSIKAIIENPKEFEKKHVLDFLTKALERAEKTAALSGAKDE